MVVLQTLISRQNACVTAHTGGAEGAAPPRALKRRWLSLLWPGCSRTGCAFLSRFCSSSGQRGAQRLYFPRLGDTGAGRGVSGSFVHSGAVWDWPVALLAERYAKRPCVVMLLHVTGC